MRYLFFLFLFSTLSATAQEDQELERRLPGVWKGSLYNDTTRKYIPYELAISEKNGRFSGYSYTLFMIDSIANIGVKDVSIKYKRGWIVVEDKKLLDNNYIAPPAKGVHTTIEIQLSENDTALVLSGSWSTNPTRQYNALTGSIWLSKKKEPLKTRIIPKLATMNLAKGLSFVTAEMIHKLHDGAIANNRPVPPPTLPKKSKNDEPVMTIVEPELVISMPLPRDSARPRHIDYTAINMDSIAARQPHKKINGAPDKPTPSPDDIAPTRRSIDLSKRTVHTIRTVDIAADSLVFTLYDNGTVDGDTVSVLLNGKVILSRVGLSVAPVNKTIHLTPEMGDSIKIVMYAENLGSLPPNTGLLIIREADNNYEIRFSGDLKKNSAIILKRIKK